MKTITFYSYKGGTGRSLAVANAARYLVQMNFKVAVVDFDLEAPGLHYKFADAHGNPLAVEQGLADYLYQYIVEGKPAQSLADYFLPIAVPGVDGASLHLMPAGNAPSPRYWATLARLDWHALFYTQNAQGVALFMDLQNRIAETLQPDFLLIDSRTGITEMGGVATTVLADRVICLVLPSKENLEGSRAILRGIQRARRDFALPSNEISIVLSRLRADQEQSDEQAILDKIRSFMTEPAEALQDSLACEHVFTLHTEPALELQESLRVGSDIRPEDSVLLRDYLRLFFHLISKESLNAKLDVLIQQARDKMWSDPDGAVKTMEELAESFGHPHVYRELLHFYQVRNIGDERALKLAQRYWEFMRNANDEFLWRIVRPGLKQLPPSWGRKWVPDWEFVVSIWRAAGQREAAFALELADFYNKAQSTARLADMVLEAIQAAPPSAPLLAKAIRLLDQCERADEADALIETWQIVGTHEPQLLDTWADHILRFNQREQARRLVAQSNFEILERDKLASVLTLLEMAGENDRAARFADEALEAALKNRDMSDLHSIGRWFIQNRSKTEFEEKIRGRLPDGMAEDVIRRLRLK